MKIEWRDRYDAVVRMRGTGAKERGACKEQGRSLSSSLL